MRRIRLAQAADLPALAAIERAAAILFPVGRIPDIDDVMPPGELEKALDMGLLYVAQKAGTAVGFAMARELDDGLLLAVMAVHPAEGRRGLGRELLSAVLDQAAQRHCPRVLLTTFADLPFNAAFYAKAGFRVLGDAQLNASIRRILAHEASLGMSNRVAMACELTNTPKKRS